MVWGVTADQKAELLGQNIGNPVGLPELAAPDARRVRTVGELFVTVRQLVLALKKASKTSGREDRAAGDASSDIQGCRHKSHSPSSYVMNA